MSDQESRVEEKEKRVNENIISLIMKYCFNGKQLKKHYAKERMIVDQLYNRLESYVQL
jgi:hypothetical protein